MPTENRSSSTKMVSRMEIALAEFLRGKMTRLRNSYTRAFEAGRQARGAEQPADQHQGEPEGYPPCDYCGVTPDHHPWHGSGLLAGIENRHIHACNDCRGNLPAHPGQQQGEPVAVLYADGSVLTKAECGISFEICCKVETPLYTHADTGEVARWKNLHAAMQLQRDHHRDKADTLRAQLAERGALLREWRHGHHHTLKSCASILQRTDAALSASAEPEAKS